jgi:hypothetical protein
MDIHPDVIASSWIDATRMVFPEKVEIYSNSFAGFRATPHKKVLNLANEPRAFRQPNSEIINNHTKVDLILAFDPDLLDNCPNAVPMMCGITWIDDDGRRKCVDKEYGLSFLCGSKMWTAGHVFRRTIWDHQDRIKIPGDFWISSSSPIERKHPDNKKLPTPQSSKYLMFNKQFHICVENSVEENYFSEKIVDCFVTKTVPIYYGCPNLSEFFDMDGVLQFNDLEQLIDICESLHRGVYDHMKDAIETNYTLSLEYARNFADRLSDSIHANIFTAS